MTSFHTRLTAEGQRLSTVEDGPALFTITYVRTDSHLLIKPWSLHDMLFDRTHWFKTMEGAQFYALHLQAEAE